MSIGRKALIPGVLDEKAAIEYKIVNRRARGELFVQPALSSFVFLAVKQVTTMGGQKDRVGEKESEKEIE